MKVCDVVWNSIWHDPRVRKQITEYVNAGFDLVCVGVMDKRYDADRISAMPCKVVVVDIDPKLKGRKITPYGKIKRENAWNRALYQAMVDAKPDLIHANDLNALIPAYKAAKKLKCKLVYDSHEIFIENDMLMNKKIYAKILERKERKMCKEIDKMICVSNAAAEYFEKKYNMQKPMVITNCSLKAERVTGGEKTPEFEVLNQGQFYAARGYDIMVESIPLLKEYPDVKLAVRGFGTLEESLRNRVKELDGDNFIFYPRVLVEELIAYASKSWVGVAITENTCVNYNLSVSNKLFEYAAAGLPVIMSDIPEHRYLNDKYHFGIVLEENTPKAFADAVIKLYTDKEFYDECARNAEIFSKEVNWENEFARLIEFEKGLFPEK